MFALTDETGAVVERYDYVMFGHPEFYAPDGTPRTESAVGNPYLFTGRRFDPETQWYYYRTRYYQPLRGQFTTLDPLGIWGDPLNAGNGYAYCGNNPWTLVDPYGLEGEWQVLKDGPGAVWWCLFGEEDPSIGQPITPEQVRSADRVRRAGSREGLIYGCYTEAVLSGASDANAPEFGPQVWAVEGYGDAAHFAATQGCQVGGTAVLLGSISLASLASPAVVFTTDGLYVVTDVQDGRVDDPVTVTLFVIGGVAAARSVDCSAKCDVRVYQSFGEAGEVTYVGITNNLSRRAAEQLRRKGIIIDEIAGLGVLSRSDARAVEQALIELHSIEKNGGTLKNLINSIAKSNEKHAAAIRRGTELLKRAGYPGI